MLNCQSQGCVTSNKVVSSMSTLRRRHSSPIKLCLVGEATNFVICRRTPPNPVSQCGRHADCSTESKANIVKSSRCLYGGCKSHGSPDELMMLIWRKCYMPWHGPGKATRPADVMQTCVSRRLLGFLAGARFHEMSTLSATDVARFDHDC